MLLVGLTGGIACGKSTVSAMLLRAGIPVLDADLLAYDVVQPGRWGYRRVVRAFGPGVLHSDGALDREALASLVFSDAAARRRLNAATHPAVGLALAQRLLLAWLRCEPLLVVDMPLLFETGFHRLCRPRVLVACSPETQRARLAARDGLAPAAVEARLAAQMPLAAKRRLASLVLENDGSREQLAAQVDALVTALRQRAWAHRYLLSPPGLLAGAAAAATAWAWWWR
ncbi:hypothetical protein ABPG75_006288 [Micractinium tetrahymenae]